jgi:hypothetical protein
VVATSEASSGRKTSSTDSLLSGSSDARSAPPEEEEEEAADSGTDGHAAASIASSCSDDEQQNRVVEECVRLDVLVSDGTYEDVEAPSAVVKTSTDDAHPDAPYSKVIKVAKQQCVRIDETTSDLLPADADAGNSDTLKDIQQTLQMLEEKVRMYETRATGDHDDEQVRRIYVFCIARAQ